MQITQKQPPNVIQKFVIESMGHLFRDWLKVGRGAIFSLIFPEGAHFDYDFTITNYGKPYSGNLKFGIDHHIFFYQIFEPYNINILQTVAQYLKSQGNVVNFLDVGANVGSHSHFMVDYADSIHSFEPHPEIFKSLEAKRNSYGSKGFYIHQFGLSDEDNTLQYYEPATHNTGTGSFVSGSSINEGSSINLLVKQGDRALKDLQLPSVSMMKMDVEGFEGFVLRGLSETVQRDRPIILMEMSQPTRQVMADHQLSLESLLYSDVKLFEVCPVGKYGKFKLEPRTFLTLNPGHHDLLVVPTEDIKNLFLMFRKLKKLVE
jgi:FkbM family methyltransferase